MVGKQSCCPFPSESPAAAKDKMKSWGIAVDDET